MTSYHSEIQLITFPGNFDPKGIILIFPTENKSFIIDEGT